MSIGTTIKKIRKEKDLTQEQLAEYLGVSAQAVSGWECDKSAPDISQLPILANIFDITIDELLGVDITKKNDRIQLYINEADKLYRAWKLAEMVEVMRKACAEFPGSDELRYRLAWSLGQAQHCIRTRKENLDEAIMIAEKILEKSADTQMRLRATSLMTYLYYWNGDNKTALSYANQLPGLTQTNGYLIGRLGLKDGKERVSYAKSKIREYYVALQENALLLCDLDTSANIEARKTETVDVREKISILEELIKLQSVVFGEDLLGENFYAMHFCYNLAALYLEIDNKDVALDYLEKAFMYAEKFQSYDEKATFSSAMQKGVSSPGRNTWCDSAFEDMRSELCDKEFCGKYEKLKGNTRYEQLLVLIAEKLETK